MTRFRRRLEESLRVSLPLQPPTKKTRAGTKAAARAALAEAFGSGVLAQWARQMTTWPKPRAAIALSLHLFSGSERGGRIDNICKWLLDELAGHVYADDRQIKLLFAQVSRPQPMPTWLAPHSTPTNTHDGWGSLLPEVDRLVTETAARGDAKSSLYITAQTRANVYADLRAVSELGERWDPFDDEYGLHRQSFAAAEFRRDDLLDYRATLDTGSDHDVLWRQLMTRQIDYHDQAQQQHAVDLFFSSLFTKLPVDRFRLWGRVQGSVAYTPYLFNIGVIPRRGESDAFRQRLRDMLEERRRQWPGLFPMRARSGISMVLFEDAESGKDLDNLIRTVLPDILEILRPQRHDLQGWVADEADPSDGDPDVPFIEVAAFPAELADVPAGSVVFGLSTADRRDSWWELAAAHLERVLQDAEDENW